MRALALFVFLVCSSASAWASDLMVFAGSASQPPLEEAAGVYQKMTGTRVIMQFGGSGSLLSQMKLTGRGDIFIPGSPDFMAMAREANLVDPEDRILAYLIPAIVVPKGNPANIQTLSDLSRTSLRVGLADPEAVCVGLYAIELLMFNELLNKVRPNLAGMVESCAKSASLVPLGQVDAVLGWREFASWSPASCDVILLQPGQVPRIAYIPAALIATSRKKTQGLAFLDFLSGSEGRAIFEKWGYFTNEADIRQLAPHASMGGEFNLPKAW